MSSDEINSMKRKIDLQGRIIHGLLAKLDKDSGLTDQDYKKLMSDLGYHSGVSTRDGEAYTDGKLAGN